MLIACLGWGSLVWNPGSLPTRGTWFTDGPFLPIEFARQSRDDRITLVIVPERPLVRSLWTVLSMTDLEGAQEALRSREGISKKNLNNHIGVWTDSNQSSQEDINKRIGVWAEGLGLDAVIWTNLPPKFRDESDRVPTAEQVVSHLSALKSEKREEAERYIRMAPLQIDTDYRRYIESELHWTPFKREL